MTVLFHYSYRDAAGYPAFGKAYFEGQLADGDAEALAEAADSDGDGFAASQVGLPPLQPEMARHGCVFPTPDDHGTSEIPWPPEDSGEDGVTDPRTWREFVEEFTAMRGRWDPVAEAEMLGIDLTAQWGDEDWEGDGDE